LGISSWQSLQENLPIHEALEASTEAAKKGMEGTIPLVARKGRASYLGERSAGHQDPGATSSYMILKVAADTWKDAS
jgi:dihydroxyacetone kinase-like protein